MRPRDGLGPELHVQRRNVYGVPKVCAASRPRPPGVADDSDTPATLLLILRAGAPAAATGCGQSSQPQAAVRAASHRLRSE
eukprot:CAMPEP_0181175908 /NCGR_PEP_ID=MMETSP1096-20121128/4334_1 /TAXON_ID=156174 ORGANISM="Chrysochromulina ericina, Strain CCMP281" /NCGR_SAMPLE_ID=MMETSP1096 /ASSEMBLY_ACC=CAM_ASM_000453 /LENGTH=80 /DNA_ID=CAMNT_0023263935 /DNA_START=418 /DNA_END=657 /DNA_ORIENTATION=-